MTEPSVTPDSGTPDGSGPDSGTPDDAPLDGNALAGALREVFAVDVTVATYRCVGCGTAAIVAELKVYDRAPGLVARCRTCSDVVLRLVRGPDRAWLDLRGVVSLEMPLESKSALAGVGSQPAG